MNCIAFDLDNTLVHATEHPCGDATAHPVLKQTMWIHLRPHVRELLRSAMMNFKVGIWTAGSREYAHEVADHLGTICGIDSFEFVLSRDDAIIYRSAYVKDLDVVRKLTGLDDVYLVDDNPVHLCVPRNRSRVIHVQPFYYTDDAPADCALCYLMIQIEVMSRVLHLHRPVPLRPVFSVA